MNIFAKARAVLMLGLDVYCVYVHDTRGRLYVKEEWNSPDDAMDAVDFWEDLGWEVTTDF